MDVEMSSGDRRREAEEDEKEMDPMVWCDLPADLLERILAFLPLQTIRGLRSSCRRLRGLLLSPSFLTLFDGCSTAPAPATNYEFLILSHPQLLRLSLYSSLCDWWIEAPLPPPSAHLLSSSSGLLLFSLPSSSSFLIFNPVTAFSRVIPSPIHHHGHPYPAGATLISVTSPHPHGYKIFLPSPSSNFIFLYDSLTHSWSQFPVPATASFLNYNQEGVLFNSCIYFTTPEPFSVFGFDTATGRLEPMPGPALPEQLAFVRLVSNGWKLYLVGGVGADGIARSLMVWELQEERWEEFERLPEYFFSKLVSVCYHNYAHVYCYWHEDMLCLCCTTWPEVLFFKEWRRSWRWLPRCPFLQDKWSCGFRWFSFVADLYALV